MRLWSQYLHQYPSKYPSEYERKRDIDWHKPPLKKNSFKKSLRENRNHSTLLTLRERSDHLTTRHRFEVTLMSTFYVQSEQHFPTHIFPKPLQTICSENSSLFIIASINKN